jgi:hypothetical protein
MVLLTLLEIFCLGKRRNIVSATAAGRDMLARRRIGVGGDGHPDPTPTPVHSRKWVVRCNVRETFEIMGQPAAAAGFCSTHSL